jgi:hypothetical protein
VAISTLWRIIHHDGKIIPRLVRVRGARPPTFTLSTITREIVVYALAERTDTLPLFLLYPYKYSVASILLFEVYWRGKCVENRNAKRRKIY